MDDQLVNISVRITRKEWARLRIFAKAHGMWMERLAGAILSDGSRKLESADSEKAEIEEAEVRA